MRKLFLLLTCAFAIGTSSTSVAQVVLNGASAWPKGHAFSTKFERFIDVVNERGKGKIRIDYKGGAPAVGSPFTLAQRARAGVFDVISITGPYYDNVVPEALALTLTEVSIQEQRKNGAYDLFNQAHQKKGFYYLGKSLEYVPFQLYLRKPINKADLTGMRVRIAPHHQPLFTALGASTIRTDLSEIYTYMENGSIDGFAWPLHGFLQDWYRVVKFRLEPGFYDADIQIIVNLSGWNKIPAEEQKLLKSIMLEFEESNKAESAKLVEAARKAQEDAGVQAITLSSAESLKWSKAAKDEGWKAVIQRSAEFGPKLRKLVTTP